MEKIIDKIREGKIALFDEEKMIEEVRRIVSPYINDYYRCKIKYNNNNKRLYINCRVRARGFLKREDGSLISYQKYSWIVTKNKPILATISLSKIFDRDSSKDGQIYIKLNERLDDVFHCNRLNEDTLNFVEDLSRYNLENCI